jgi:hypothetical protein
MGICNPKAKDFANDVPTSKEHHLQNPLLLDCKFP